MTRRTLTWAGLVAVLAILALVLIPGAVLAKKGGGGKPKPPPPPPSDPDPAITFVKAYKHNVEKVMVMNADGSNKTIVFDGDGADIGHRSDWSPDGTKLVFWSDVNGKGIYVYDLAGETLTKICSTMTGFDFVCRPSWSPTPVPDGAVGDGETYYIAFTDQSSDQINDVYLVEPVAGSTPVNLTNTEFVYEIGPTWSPSAGKLVIKWAHDDYRVGDKFIIYDLVAGTYTVKQHQGPFEGKGVSGYAFSHQDEDKLVCCAYGDIWVLDLDDLANPARLDQTGNMQESRPCWSPDDTKILFKCAESKGGSGKLGNHRFEVMSSTDGSGRTTVTNEASFPVWRHSP